MIFFRLAGCVSPGLFVILPVARAVLEDTFRLQSIQNVLVHWEVVSQFLLVQRSGVSAEGADYLRSGLRVFASARSERQ